jgi:glutathione S-transferase
MAAMTQATATLIGSPVSPFVRKVLAVCALKGIEVEIDPIVAFYADDAFEKISPLRRIPVYRDERVTLCDSSVICQYLEDRYPQPALYPADIAQRAEARWLEEYADTRMSDVCLWRIFNAAVIGPAIWNRPRNKEAIQQTIATDLPPIFDYLESRMPREGCIFGALSIGDIAIEAILPNLSWARVEIDAARWPKLAAWRARLGAMEPFLSLERAAGALMRVPPGEQRKAVAELGFRVTRETFATPTARPGPMTQFA